MRRLQKKQNILHYRLSLFSEYIFITAMSKKENNILLQKSELGKIKSGFHQLPSETHTYGKAPQKDQYGARDVISGWQQHRVSQIKETGKDFVAMNREGIKQGHISAKQTSEFRKENQIKVKVKEGQKYYGVSIPNEQFIYGVPNRPSTPIKDVICNVYAQQQAQLKKQRDAVMNMLAKDSKKSPPKVEVSVKHNLKDSKKKEVQDHQFKLAKFKNVESKVKPMMSNPGAH